MSAPATSPGTGPGGRHGIVTPGAGLLNPNHFLSAAVAYLFGGGRDWRRDVAVGKTAGLQRDARSRRRRPRPPAVRGTET